MTRTVQIHRMDLPIGFIMHPGCRQCRQIGLYDIGLDPQLLNRKLQRRAGTVNKLGASVIRNLLFQIAYVLAAGNHPTGIQHWDLIEISIYAKADQHEQTEKETCRYFHFDPNCIHYTFISAWPGKL